MNRRSFVQDRRELLQGASAAAMAATLQPIAPELLSSEIPIAKGQMINGTLTAHFDMPAEAIEQLIRVTEEFFEDIERDPNTIKGDFL